jgi:hypothetical protein
MGSAVAAWAAMPGHWHRVVPGRLLATCCAAKPSHLLCSDAWALAGLCSPGTCCAAKPGHWLGCGWAFAVLRILGTGCSAKPGHWLGCVAWALAGLCSMGTGWAV